MQSTFGIFYLAYNEILALLGKKRQTAPSFKGFSFYFLPENTEQRSSVLLHSLLQFKNWCVLLRNKKCVQTEVQNDP